MKTRVHVNQHVIKRNARTGERAAPLSVSTYKGTRPAHEVEILGPSRVVYSPDRPLPCGARVWIETWAEVTVK